MFLPFIKRLVKDPICIGRVKLFELRWPVRWTLGLPYFIPNEWRNTHIHCIGLTGSGKSTLLKNLFVQDVEAGRGCALIDPDEDLAFAVLRALLASGYFGKYLGTDKAGTPQFAWNQEALDRVIYFEPARQSDWAIPFNVLNNPTFESDELAGHITEAFSRAWSSIKEAPRFISVAYPALLLLIEARKTLPDLYPLLEHIGYRLEVLKEQENQTFVKLFLNEFKLWHETQANNNESVTNKLTFQIFNSSVNRSMKLHDNHINASQIMDEGKVLIVCLRNLSDPIQRMFGNFITVLFEQAALKRPESGGRRPFYYYLDEFHDYCANEGSALSLARILSRCRKRNFRAHLFHQTLGQIKSHLGEALDNVGLFLSFVVGHTDSHDMIHKMKTRSEDWQDDSASMEELQKYNYWMHLRATHRVVPLITDMPKPRFNIPNGAIEELIKQLEQRHGVYAPRTNSTPQAPKPTQLSAPKKDWTKTV